MVKSRDMPGHEVHKMHGGTWATRGMQGIREHQGHAGQQQHQEGMAAGVQGCRGTGHAEGVCKGVAL